MDYYLEDLTRLNDQPKVEIGNYVESNDILVPKRFSSLKEARASGSHIIARSEHSQDYSGASGIIDSVLLDYEEFNNIYDEEELKQAIIKEQGFRGNHERISKYCRLLNVSEEKFKQEISFSFWELLGGYNRVVVADSSIPNRYHIMTHFGLKEKHSHPYYNYTLFEDKKVIQEFIRPLTEELREGVPKLIDFYENIRNLGRFDKNHCPILEVQTSDNKNYFLQYHRSRDFVKVDFSLDDLSLQNDMVVVPFVRGATSKEGLDCKVAVCYVHMIQDTISLHNEDGSWDIHVDPVFSELKVRSRLLQMQNMHGEFWWQLVKYVSNHVQKSRLFKPQVSAIVDIDKLYKKGESLTDFHNFVVEKGIDSYMDLHIVSDGRKAYVRRI